jgi:hypothetical protein
MKKLMCAAVALALVGCATVQRQSLSSADLSTAMAAGKGFLAFSVQLTNITIDPSDLHFTFRTDTGAEYIVDASHYTPNEWIFSCLLFAEEPRENNAQVTDIIVTGGDTTLASFEPDRGSLATRFIVEKGVVFYMGRFILSGGPGKYTLRIDGTFVNADKAKLFSDYPGAFTDTMFFPSPANVKSR